MPPLFNALRQFPPERQAARLGPALWIAFTLAILVATSFLGPERQSVMRHYRTASLAWLGSDPIYSGTEGGFLYLPSFAVLHAPLALLPFKLDAALWRLANLALLGFGLRRLVRAGDPSRREGTFLVASIAVLALSYSGARHGQATLAMAGTMMGAAGALADRRFRRAALWCGVGLAIKPLIIVFLLLAAAAHRRLILPLLGAVVAVLLLPWLAQDPSYVAQQYVDCARMLRVASDPTEPLLYPTLITALTVLGLPVPALPVRVVAALATLGVYLRVRRVFTGYLAAMCLYTLAATYLLLFSPRTEHNTYSLLGPGIGLFAALAWSNGRIHVAGMNGLVLLFVFQDRDLLKHIGLAPIWTKPLYTVIFLVLAWIQLRPVANATPSSEHRTDATRTSEDRGPSS